MTIDFSAPGPRATIFIDDAPAFRLVDATVAANRLDMERHTLACYRSLGCGPRWFRIGKWPRYAIEDLDRWLAGQPLRAAKRTLGAVWPVDYLEQALVPSAVAARILTVSRHCLANYRAENIGPPCRHAGRRIFYALSDLLEWTAAQKRRGTGRHGVSSMSNTPAMCRNEDDSIDTG